MDDGGPASYAKLQPEGEGMRELGGSTKEKGRMGRGGMQTYGNNNSSKEAWSPPNALSQEAVAAERGGGAGGGRGRKQALVALSGPSPWRGQ